MSDEPCSMVKVFLLRMWMVVIPYFEIVFFLDLKMYIIQFKIMKYQAWVVFFDGLVFIRIPHP